MVDSDEDSRRCALRLDYLSIELLKRFPEPKPGFPDRFLSPYFRLPLLRLNENGPRW
jgi:hypothetical protein